MQKSYTVISNTALLLWRSRAHKPRGTARHTSPTSASLDRYVTRLRDRLKDREEGVAGKSPAVGPPGL